MPPSAAAVVAFALAGSLPAALASGPQLLHSFRLLNFTFPTPQATAEYFDNKWYQNCMLAGIKVSPHGDTFVSVPRWFPNVPATLSRLRPSPVAGAPPLLEPFPSWEANKAGDPRALQSVLGFEIDSCNRLWVLDQGKVAGQAALPGAIKLVVYNATTGTELWRLEFDSATASPDRSFLNDIVLDLRNDFAYITDSGISVRATDAIKGGLIAVDLRTGRAARVLDAEDSDSVQAERGLQMFINGARVNGGDGNPMMTGADGIALSTDAATLYFCPLTSFHIYSVPTSEMRCVVSGRCTPSSLAQQVRDLGTRDSASDGLAVDNTGRLYLTSLQHSGIQRATSLSTVASGVETLTRDDREMVWPDTIGWDGKGSLVFVSNNLHRFVNRSLDYGEDNYRIWSLDVGATSYMDAVANPACVLPSPETPPRAGPSNRKLLLGLVLGGIGLIAAGSVALALRARARQQARLASEYHAMRETPLS